MTPFEVVYWRKPPTLTQYLPEETLVTVVSQEPQDRDELLKQLIYNLEHAHQRTKKHDNAHQEDISLQVMIWYS